MPLFDHLGYGEKRNRNRQPDCLSGFQVEGQFEFHVLRLHEQADEQHGHGIMWHDTPN